MDKKAKNVITIVLLTVIPILIMLPFAISKNRIDYIEISLIVFGCLELLVLNVRVGRRERNNRKLYNRYKSDPKDEGFDEYRNLYYRLMTVPIENDSESMTKQNFVI